MIENQLESLRKDYIKSDVPIYLAQNGWADLSTKLSPVKATAYRALLTKGFVIASVFILILTGVVGAAQVAKPGNLLYPVKILSDNIVAKVTGNYEYKIDRRAQEVIELSGEPSKNLDDANNQYQKSLEEAKQKEGESWEFKQTLDKQEEKFKQAQKENPSSQRGLEEAIQHTQQTKGEVQGQKDEHPPQNNQNQENNQGQQKGKNK